MGVIANRVKYHIDGFRDRFEKAVENINSKPVSRRRGYASAGVKRNRDLYRNGGEFKSRF